jgi:hypothetical protein
MEVNEQVGNQALARLIFNLGGLLASSPLESIRIRGT